MVRLGTAAALLAVCLPAMPQSADNVLVVVNGASSISRTIGEYYARRRAVPMRNVCRIHAPLAEEISRDQYNRLVAAPVAACLRSRGLIESVLYIVTTSEVPLKIRGTDGPGGDAASVDSELSLLYPDLHGRPHPLPGHVPNPFFDARDKKFAHPQFPIYLVTRLAGYDFADVKGMVDRALQAANRGKFVIDMKSGDDTPGNDWLRDAAILLPKDRVIFDPSPEVLYNQKDVIGYASWGSNDPHRKQRLLHFEWLPGAIATEYVSTDARTFARPPEDWNISTWDAKDRGLWFAGSPQTMTADYIHEGATGASGHVYEPYLVLTPRPDLVLPAYYRGRNLAESYYLGIRGLSWQNIVVGDPLCSIGPPR